MTITEDMKQVAKEAFMETLETFKTGHMLAWDQKTDIIKESVGRSLWIKFPSKSSSIRVVPYTEPDSNYNHHYKLKLEVVESVEIV